jgi:hypothetical protein
VLLSSEIGHCFPISYAGAFMAILAPPILPLYLYRYRSLGKNGSFLSRELDAVKRSYIWCSTFKNLNDPMEGFYSPSALLKAKDDYRNIVRAISEQDKFWHRGSQRHVRQRAHVDALCR